MKATTSMVCVALLTFAAACHTRTAADPSQEEKAAQKVEDGDHEDGDHKDKDGDHKDGEKEHANPAKASKADGEASSHAHSTADADKKSDASEGAKKDGKDGKSDGIDPEDIEVSTSAQGLLKPGAEDRVREKLGVDKGEGMATALRKFQREHDLPATGMLDHETVIKLGLEPSDIWQRAH